MPLADLWGHSTTETVQWPAWVIYGEPADPAGEWVPVGRPQATEADADRQIVLWQQRQRALVA